MPLDFRDIGPPRTGNRGGLGLFNWNDIAKDKDKTHYLGNSVKSLTGMWAKRKNLTFFNEGRAEVKEVELDEIAQIKRMEAEAMAAALGAKSSALNPEDQQHVDELIKNELENQSKSFKGEKIVGLGVQGSARREMEHATKRAHRYADEEDSHRGRRDKERDHNDYSKEKRLKKDKIDSRDRRDRRDDRGRSSSRSRSRRDCSRSRESRYHHDKKERPRSHSRSRKERKRDSEYAHDKKHRHERRFRSRSRSRSTERGRKHRTPSTEKRSGRGGL